MKFRPLHDRVVIRRAERGMKSMGGIIIPDNAKENPQGGDVMAFGPGSGNEGGHVISLNVKSVTSSCSASAIGRAQRSRLTAKTF